MVWLSFGDEMIFSTVASSAFCPVGVPSAASSWLELSDELPDEPPELLPDEPPDDPPEDPPDEPPDEPDIPPPEDEPLLPLDDDISPPELPLEPWLDPAPVVPCWPFTVPDALPPDGGWLPRCIEHPERSRPIPASMINRFNNFTPPWAYRSQG